MSTPEINKNTLNGPRMSCDKQFHYTMYWSTDGVNFKNQNHTIKYVVVNTTAYIKQIKDRMI